MLGIEHHRASHALARVETFCAVLFVHPVHIWVRGDEADDDDFGEVSILTSDPDVEIVETLDDDCAAASPV